MIRILLLAWIKKHLQGDPIIWTVVFLLSLISILVVYSATGTIAYKMMDGNTEHYLLKHSAFMILGFAAMWLAHKIDYRYYSKISKFALWLSLPLLFIAWRMGVINSAGRWITIPFINQSFQPSDLAKFALIANLASMLAKKQDDIENIKDTIVPMLGWCGVICCAIALSNMSTAIMMFATCMLLMYIGRVPMRYLIMLCLVGILVLSVAMMVGQRAGTAVNRIKNFMNTKTIPFQAQQSYIAIATGGMIGKGPGNSTQRNFLPHPYSDFIYSIIIEEYGLVGGLIVLILYLLLLYRGMITVQNSNRAFGGLLSAGLCFMVVIQAMINMGVAVGLGPITGLPLPLLSMGGTSLLFSGVAIGTILSVSKGDGQEFGPNDEILRN